MNSPMDKIVIEQMDFYGYHGVLAEEKKVGQRFLIDIEMGLDLKAAGGSDDLADTVNYAAIYDGVKDIVTNNSYDLIEKLAEEIATYLLNEEKISMCKVRVNKPQAPIAGIFKNVSVEIVRGHHG